MSRTAWFHCFSGVAGDMALGALLDAGAGVEEVAGIVGALGVEGWTLGTEGVMRRGLAATRAVVGTPDDHTHHRPYGEIRALLDNAPQLPERVRARAHAVFAALATVEGRLHGMPADDVEFHEVGALDAIVDVVGTCAALEVLGVDDVVCSPIAVGRGTVHAAHGVLPNPAPAVVALAATYGVPLAGVDEPLELATPTGVALVATLASSFGPLPGGTVVTAGMGAGGRDPAGRPNVVQVVIVESATISPGGRPPDVSERLVELATNVDDVTGEVIAHTVARLLEAGALDAWATPIVMKKGRPAHTLSALSPPERADAVRAVLVAETGTLGVRATVVERWAVPRTFEIVDVGGYDVRVKRTGTRVKAEFDDAAAAAGALGRPVRDVLAEAERAARAVTPGGNA